jgi:hypothetical protein
MPCDGVAVASGQVPLELTELVKTMEGDRLRDAILVLLRQQFAHLGQVKVQSLYRAHTGIRAQGTVPPATLALVISGRYLVNVRDGQVTVNTRGRARRGEAQVVQDLQEAITGLLTGLAGMAFQQHVIQAMKATGYRVTGQTRAPNGALVVQVEL